MIIRTDVPLFDKNWFETGGNAKFFAEPSSEAEFHSLIAFSSENNIPITLLGNGANVLINDDGIDGLVIKSKILDKEVLEGSLENNNILVRAGSGVLIEELITYCFDNNITGLEEFSGIPSTVGGAVYINLHYFNFLISDFLVSAVIFDKTQKKIYSVDKEWFEFGYDTSKLHQKKHILMSATFKFKKSSSQEVSYARGRSYEIIRHRKQRYPYKGTCGSFFRNFHEHEVTLEVNSKKMIFAAYYLDQVGVKGELKCGNAMVSHKHANMIVNLGGAKTNDILCVARIMQEKVYNKYEIRLQTECELLGFQNYPLLY